jgi:hypothetical protein
MRPQEINLPSTIAVKRAGPNICIADPDQYSIIDTKAATALPFHPISLDPVTKVLPQMSVASRDEYFCVTYNTPSSIGIFINGAGEPCRPPVTEWIGHPESVCIDEDLLISSMPNGRVQVYNINTQDLCQTIELPSSVTVPPTLALSRPGFSAPINQRKQTLQRLSITVPPMRDPKPPSPVTRKDATEPSGSGLTPPPTPIRPASAASALQTHGGANRQPSQFPKAHVVVFGPDCVYALLPSTIISQADGLIDSGKVQDAAHLVAQVQKKLATRPGGEGEMVRSCTHRSGYPMLSLINFATGGRYPVHPPTDRSDAFTRNGFRRGRGQFVQRGHGSSASHPTVPRVSSSGANGQLHFRSLCGTRATNPRPVKLDHLRNWLVLSPSSIHAGPTSTASCTRLTLTTCARTLTLTTRARTNKKTQIHLTPLIYPHETDRSSFPQHSQELRAAPRYHDRRGARGDVTVERVADAEQVFAEVQESAAVYFPDEDCGDVFGSASQQGALRYYFD